MQPNRTQTGQYEPPAAVPVVRHVKYAPHLFPTLMDKISRFINNYFSNRFDPVAGIFALTNIAQLVRFAYANGWIAISHTSNDNVGHELLQSTAEFWTTILNPLVGFMWLGTSVTLIFMGLLTKHRKVAMLGILSCMSFWFLVTTKIYVHLGFWAAVPNGVSLLSSIWVFDAIFGTHHDRIQLQKEVEASNKLVGKVMDMYDEEQTRRELQLSERELAVRRAEITLRAQQNMVSSRHLASHSDPSSGVIGEMRNLTHPAKDRPA